jgi:hypothetical protein
MFLKKHLFPRMSYPIRLDEVGHYAVGTQDLIPNSVLDRRIDAGMWSGRGFQKPTLYYAKGGEVEEHDPHQHARMGKAQIQALDFSNYLRH